MKTEQSNGPYCTKRNPRFMIILIHLITHATISLKFTFPAYYPQHVLQVSLPVLSFIGLDDPETIDDVKFRGTDSPVEEVEGLEFKAHREVGLISTGRVHVNSFLQQRGLMDLLGGWSCESSCGKGENHYEFQHDAT